MTDSPIAYDLIPVSYMEKGLRLYFESGILPGAFMMAVIYGDLYDAVSVADPQNRARLCDWVDWFERYAPRGSFGSAAVVADWVKSRNNARVAAQRRRDAGLNA